MNRIAPLLLLSMSLLPCLRADVAGKSHEERTRQYASRTLTIVLRDVAALDAMVIVDGPDKDKQLTAQAELKAKIDAEIKALSTNARASFIAQVDEQEAALTTQLNAENDPAAKEKLSVQLKPYKSLRERFLQATLDTGDELRAPEKHASTGIVFAGLALGLAFASGGILYARKSR